MPIYTNITVSGKTTMNWKLPKKVPSIDLIFFRKYFYAAFEKINSYKFEKTFELNQKLEKPYVYTYSQEGSGIVESDYERWLRELIKVANEEMQADKRFSMYKFDIMGDWMAGDIVVLQKGNLTKKDIDKLHKDTVYSITRHTSKELKNKWFS